MNQPKIKIAIVVQSLAYGGAERSCAILSKLLYQSGFDIHVITILDAIEYDYSGTLFNLGKCKNEKLLNRFHRMSLLRNYLKAHDFDWIIDSRTRQSWWSEWIVSRWVYFPERTIYMVRSYDLKKYFPFPLFIARLIYQKSPYIVAVSEQIKLQIQTQLGYQNLVRIYNPVEVIDVITEKEVQDNYIIAYGRIDDQIKNYSLLIEAYAISVLPQKNILLYILGDGPDLLKLKQKSALMQLDGKVIFKPKTPNPFAWVKSAMFTTLTSRYEGFPRVLIESLSVGVPVVAVDCQSGPNEIVINEKNGLLIENHNVKALAEALNRMVTDTTLYQTCRDNAVPSVAHLQSDEIAKSWKKILRK